MLRNSNAQTHPQPHDRIVTTTLSKDVEKESNIERLALHESLHLLLAPLNAAAVDRFTTNQEIETYEHEVVWLLEEMLYASSK